MTSLQVEPTDAMFANKEYISISEFAILYHSIVQGIF